MVDLRGAVELQASDVQSNRDDNASEGSSVVTEQPSVMSEPLSARSVPFSALGITSCRCVNPGNTPVNENEVCSLQLQKAFDLYRTSSVPHASLNSRATGVESRTNFDTTTVRS